MSIIIARTVALALLVGLGLLRFVWLQGTFEHEVLAILSHREVELALPVFSQFTVTQSLSFEEPALVDRFVIPMYVPVDAQPIRLTLRREGRVISRWTVPYKSANAAEAAATGVQEVVVPMAAPRWLTGKFELHFDGSAIEHDQQGRAPRVFTESADAAYPGGNYRIAENEKQGDVSMYAYEQVTRARHLQERWRDRPLRSAIGYLGWVPMLMLIWGLPILLVRSWGDTTQHTNQQSEPPQLR